MLAAVCIWGVPHAGTLKILLKWGLSGVNMECCSMGANFLLHFLPWETLFCLHSFVSKWGVCNGKCSQTKKSEQNSDSHGEKWVRFQWIESHVFCLFDDCARWRTMNNAHAEFLPWFCFLRALSALSLLLQKLDFVGCAILEPLIFDSSTDPFFWVNFPEISSIWPSGLIPQHKTSSTQQTAHFAKLLPIRFGVWSGVCISICPSSLAPHNSPRAVLHADCPKIAQWEILNPGASIGEISNARTHVPWFFVAIQPNPRPVPLVGELLVCVDTTSGWWCQWRCQWLLIRWLLLFQDDDESANWTRMMLLLLVFICFIHTSCSLKRNISQISENGGSGSLHHLIVSQSLNCQHKQWSCVELDLCWVNANQSNACVAFIILMFVALNCTKVLHLQSLRNNVVHTVCHQFIVISHLLSIHSMSSQFKMTSMSKGVDQNCLHKLSANQCKFTTLPQGHCEQMVLAVLAIHFIRGKLSTDSHLSEFTLLVMSPSALCSNWLTFIQTTSEQVSTRNSSQTVTHIATDRCKQQSTRPSVRVTAHKTWRQQEEQVFVTSAQVTGLDNAVKWQDQLSEDNHRASFLDLCKRSVNKTWTDRHQLQLITKLDNNVSSKHTVTPQAASNKHHDLRNRSAWWDTIENKNTSVRQDTIKNKDSKNWGSQNPKSHTSQKSASQPQWWHQWSRRSWGTWTQNPEQQSWRVHGTSGPDVRPGTNKIDQALLRHQS